MHGFSVANNGNLKFTITTWKFHGQVKVIKPENIASLVKEFGKSVFEHRCVGESVNESFY